MDSETDKLALRAALGHYPTGVTVVTTTVEGRPLGMTVNSFASVSLDPPLVLWSPARQSKRFAAFEAATHFAIHVLAADQRGLCDAFARTGFEPFDGLAVTPGIGSVPLLEGCSARFECIQSAGHDGGDHLILVGEVLRFEAWDRPPLVFHRGGFAEISQDAR